MRPFTRLWFTTCLTLACTLAQAEAAPPKQIKLMVTVDWEGWSLDNDNLQEMRAFRQKYPQIPMVQFLNPVYPLKFEDSAAKINSTLLPIDAHGLHIHAWKPLVEACGISYQDKPAFDPNIEHCEMGACGYSVSLEYAYDQAALTQLVACSSQMLVEQGFKRPVSFRAGGWQLGPKLALALKNSGFSMDSSRISAESLRERWGAQSNMVKLIEKLHPDASIDDTPYELLPGLMEYPNNASLADYTRTERMVEIFSALIDADKPLMVLGFHQETAVDYLRRLDDAIPQMEAIAKQKGVQIKWVAYP